MEVVIKELEKALNFQGDRCSRPWNNEVVKKLKKALKFQEDYEIWEHKLPIDYKEIIQASKTQEVYNSIEMKKDLYDMFSNGILLQDGKVLFSLGHNGERNEMISARKFSYENRRSLKWRPVQESRFEKAAKIGVVYVEGIEFRAIESVKNEELDEVQQILKSNSNKEHNEVNGKEHLMLSAKEVLYDSYNVKHFHLKPSSESRFQEAIELLPQQLTKTSLFDQNPATSFLAGFTMEHRRRYGDGNYNEALPPGFSVSKFDFSIENHFKAMDTIAMCSGESEFEYEQSEIQRLCSSVTFLRKWRDFRYQSRDIRFACDNKTPDATIQIKLPQFSSVAVPKDMSDGHTISSPFSKDSVMYVGGHVWALDWCPRAHQSSTFDTNVEFIAVSAHPPESLYHKIGAPLTGRGLIQIWCMLNTAVKDQDLTSLVKVKRKKSYTSIDPTKPKKPRGRPRKNPINKMDDSDQAKQDLSVQSPENANNLLQLVAKVETDKSFNSLSSFDGNNKHIQSLTEFNNNSSIKSSQPLAIEFPDKMTLLTPEIFAKNQVNKKEYKVYTRRPKDYSKDHSAKSTWTSSKSKLANSADLPISSQNYGSSPGQDVALPRLVMGLAHNGKVAWDVKWRPSDSSPISTHIMGYLAVLLGNGSLEVWEVPLPHVTKAIFSSCQLEGTDPRFLKLKPVFLCSMLKCGDRQSIPLTLEWSASAPHDLILAGCHDGVVVLWKFSADGLSKDTRPLLSFSADTDPIRALKWAPVAGDPESPNIIVTAGHNNVKFWDIRDPFHPLWDVSVQKNINSVDWLPDPRCVVLSFDDGEIKIISLLNAACDTPVTGMPCKKTQQHGSYSYYCSSSSIWSVQASRLTGMVAYCCSDGKVIHFQLTTKAVENDPSRNREPHYLCGSLREEDSTLTLLSSLPNTPFPMKKSSNEWGNTPKSRRGVLSKSNREKRAKDQILKCRTQHKLPSGQNLGSTGTLVVAQKTHTARETQTSQALVCIDNDNKSEEENANEVLPPKIVAIHRVRWNMNKGSERLLCYGGAAGIVRCQEIM
ncbi:hypothetical protein L1987_86833 [Smallanthus sonchifolius]|uniref:Uncharacterized protein n=1 Tax=Smallanthus sonchifolius TaxID=185202 RepID=A0ACB8Y4M3_9ASTR|nr:hypothetical protein L1987_86833 [Smallanthus sonchifolius]